MPVSYASPQMYASHSDMPMRIPTRFSRAWWYWLAAAAMIGGAAACFIYFSTVAFPSLGWLSVFLVGSFVGDVVLAIGMEAVAPSRVVIGPGDRVFDSSPVNIRAEVVSAFSASGSGRVIIRGEVWNARFAGEIRSAVLAGEEVLVKGRDGLTLLVDLIGNDT